MKGKAMLEKIVFIGSKELGFAVFKELERQFPERLKACITMEDSWDDRSRLMEFKAYCGERDLPLHILTGKCDISSQIDDYVPDLCIVVGWYYLINAELLKKVKGGFIGVHNSLLPKYRGFAPLVWQLINGEQKVGFSIFSFDEGLDTGNIFFQEEIKISEKDYIADVLKLVEERVLMFFKVHFRELLDGTLAGYAQADTGASYCGKRVESDGKVDWTWDSTRIYNYIRAQSLPYPGAYAYYNGKKIIIWKAEVFEADIYGAPGQIGLIDKKSERVIIICGENTGLAVDEIEIEGEKIRAADYIKSLSIRVK